MAKKGVGVPVRSRGPAPSNVDLVAEALREAIVNGRLKPGERIKEVPLARQLEVSRGPIRDALRQLEYDGLLQIIPNRGAVVPEVAPIDVLEVYAMRASLGSLALHKLLLDEGALPVRALERELRRFQRAVERRRGPEAADADLRYQSTIVAGAGLRRVTAEWERLTGQVRIFIAALGIRYDDSLAVMFEEIEALHAAIVERRGADAERLWREKFERWVRDFLERLDTGFDAELWAALTTGASGSLAP